MEEGEMGGSCSMRVRDYAYSIFGLKTWRER